MKNSRFAVAEIGDCSYQMVGEITALLRSHQEGDSGALDELTRLVYDDLKVIARRRAVGKGAPGASTLVNQTYLRLLDHGQLETEDRTSYFALVATIMRRIVVDEVRRACAQKRSGDEVSLDEQRLAENLNSDFDLLIDIDSALETLGAKEPLQKSVFECRYFAGFTVAETANALGVSTRTVNRSWNKAREFLGTHVSL